MIECKVVHIHDGDWRQLTNGNWHSGGEADWAGKMLSLYRNAGYEIVQILTEYCPAEQRPGVYTFYKDGFTVIFEREAGSGPEVTEEDWAELNVRSAQREAEFGAEEEEETPLFDFGDEDFPEEMFPDDEE